MAPVIHAQPQEISRYVFCPGSQERALRIAEHFEDMHQVSDYRGIVVYSGIYHGVFMTSCGTGMGGPAVAFALEELGRLGADTFIRVGSCGVYQQGQGPGDVIISNGSVRLGGTGDFYLPVEYPAVPAFPVTRALALAAEELGIDAAVGVGVTGDGFYNPPENSPYNRFLIGNPVYIEMESDTVFLVGAVRGWRTGALFTSDGAPGEIQPEWGIPLFRQGVENSIRIALRAMEILAGEDNQAG